MSAGDAGTEGAGSPMPPAHHAAPSGTSDAAARSVAPRTPTQRQRVLAAILAAGTHGLTDDEGERQTGIRPQTYTPRRGELVKAGRVIATGRRRRTRRQFTATVWIAAEFAEATEPAAHAPERPRAGGTP